MSDIIRLLPDSVANQIAAGEVIQRPASIIKELVENSVDAGATRIAIYIQDAGRTLVQVVDNGKGMSETDSRMAFERHATSKITSAEDLDSLTTMGFRGEALPSICAVAQVEMLSRTADSPLGTRLAINGSKVAVQEPCACDTGTNIKVKNLFFNVPARRRFLKSDSVELSNIMREFERLALVNTDIHLSIDTGTRSIDLRPATLKNRILDIWKNSLNPHLLPIDVDTSIVKLTGFVCKPEHVRRRNPQQYLIVNGRNMRHPYFHRAILNCYAPMIPKECQPSYFIKLEVDPSTIDVNVHPTKNEIKFENEQEIFHILSSAVKTAIGKFDVPPLEFEQGMPEFAPPKAGDVVEPPTSVSRPEYNPFRESRPQRQNVRDWENLYSRFSADTAPQAPAPAPLPLEAAEEPAPLCIQFALKYIVTSTRNGLVIIDQHRAHVRILYEQLLAAARMEKPVGQHVMFPETLELDAAQQPAFEAMEDELTRLGFGLEYMEGNSWQITSVPASLNEANPVEVIREILATADAPETLESSLENPEEALLRRAALVMARSGAIRRGRRLGASEMEGIISKLFSLPDPRFTPNGNPIFASLDEARLEAMLNK